MKPRTWHGSRHCILYDAEQLENPGIEWFDAEQLHAAGCVDGEASGRGQALFLRVGTRPCVLRHYRRGGLFAKLLGDRYLRVGAERSRPFREWRLLAELTREGLPVPHPVAARLSCHGLFCRADLITGRIEGAVTLVDHLAEDDGPPLDWAALGTCLRRFHDHGIWHADLNARNILTRTGAEFFLIDFDRGRRRRPGRWQRANLERLRRSLRKMYQAGRIDWQEQTDWPALEHGYAQAGKS